MPATKMLAKNAPPLFSIGLDGVRARMHADHGNEHDEADVHQQALRRLGDRAEHRVPAAHPPGRRGRSPGSSRQCRARGRRLPAFSLSRPSRMPAQIPPARNVRSVFDRSRSTNPTVPARALDVIGRADDPQDVAALDDRPRLARHQLGASLQRLEIDAARLRIRRQLSEGAAVDLAVRDHDGDGLHRHGQQGGIVELRADVPLGVGNAPAACADTTSRSPRLQRRAPDRASATRRRVGRAARTAVHRRIVLRAPPGSSPPTCGVLDAVRADAVVGARRRPAPPALPAGERLLELLRLALEVRPHDLRAEPREEQDQAKVAEPVGNRIRKGRVGR